MQQNILSVWQVNNYIKNLLDNDYIVRRLWVQGEISNCKLHSSGHLYFTLKDASSAISCVLFKGYRTNNPINLRDGMKVIAQGSISVYERTGQYQLYVKEIVEDGIGLLYQRFEALKQKLEQLGWFQDKYKKPIPLYPKKVGIVTSETGAVIQDIINVARRRNPYIQLILYPTRVQGDEAKYEIVKGIEYFDNRDDIDVIIIGRGGGSIEDLWAYNEEMVAKAIFEAKTPIISAVGHETDFTIADFVSDLRAPTPSAAAELAIPTIQSIEDLISQYEKRMLQTLSQRILRQMSKLEVLSAKLALHHPIRQLEQYMQYLNELQDRMTNCIDNSIQKKQTELLVLKEKLSVLSPINRLSKGYAYISNELGQGISSVKNIETGDTLNIHFIDGLAKVQVKNLDYKGGLSDE